MRASPTALPLAAFVATSVTSSSYLPAAAEGGGWIDCGKPGRGGERYPKAGCRVIRDGGRGKGVTKESEGADPFID